MKRFFLQLLMLLFVVSATAQFQKAELQASGLTCSMCSNAINKALRTLNFVDTIETDLEKNLFTVSFKESKQVDFDEIRKKVENAGFSVANFWVYTSFDNQQLKANEPVSLGGLNLQFVNVKDQLLNGEYRVKIIEKNFTLPKEQKKWAGKLASNAAAGHRVYYVTI
jgi:copper chaperone CopZ